MVLFWWFWWWGINYTNSIIIELLLQWFWESIKKALFCSMLKVKVSSLNEALAMQRDINRCQMLEQYKYHKRKLIFDDQKTHLPDGIKYVIRLEKRKKDWKRMIPCFYQNRASSRQLSIIEKQNISSTERKFGSEQFETDHSIEPYKGDHLSQVYCDVWMIH